MLASAIRIFMSSRTKHYELPNYAAQANESTRRERCQGTRNAWDSSRLGPPGMLYPWRARLQSVDESTPHAPSQGPQTSFDLVAGCPERQRRAEGRGRVTRPHRLGFEAREQFSSRGGERVLEARARAHAAQDVADRLIAAQRNQELERAVSGGVHGLLLGPVQLRRRPQQVGGRVRVLPAPQLVQAQTAVSLPGGDRRHALAEPERRLLRESSFGRLQQLVHERVRQLVREQLRHLLSRGGRGIAPAPGALQEDLVPEGPRAQPGIAAEPDQRLERLVVRQHAHGDAVTEPAPAR